MHVGNQTFVPAPRAFRNGVHRLRKLAVIEKTPSFYDSICIVTNGKRVHLYPVTLVIFTG